MLSRVRISFLLVAAIAAACSDSTSPSPPVQPMIATGGAHTCRLASTGSASCWGDNSSGELGDGSTTSSVTPVPVSGGIAFTTIAAGGSYTCGLDRDGAAYCWGTNIGGELGSGTTVQNASVPGPVSGGLSFVGLAAGTNHACALTRDGAAYCWGSNELQELGTGDTVRRLVPTAVSGGLSFSTLAAGGDHTCGIAKSGAAYPLGRQHLRTAREWFVSKPERGAVSGVRGLDVHCHYRGSGPHVRHRLVRNSLLLGRKLGRSGGEPRALILCASTNPGGSPLHTHRCGRCAYVWTHEHGRGVLLGQG